MNNKGIAPLVVIVIVIAVLAIGGYFVLKTKVAVAPTQSPTISSTTAPNEASGWKTYTNTKYGFELKFPSNWSGYKVGAERKLTDGGTSISFDFPFTINGTKTYYNSAFQIIIYPISVWPSVQLSDGSKPLKLTENNNYIYSYAIGQDLGGNSQLETAASDMNSILSTFKFTSLIQSFSKCLPADIKLDDIADANITVEQKLNALKAICNSANKLVDATGKQITFYHLTGCWGNPPSNYLELLQKQQDEINKLKEQYTVIEMTCNPSGIPIQ